MSEDVIVLGQETFNLDTSVKPLTDFFSYYDSGLMIHNGTGVILHRYGYGSEQIVYQMEPQVKGVTYKQNESSESSRTYNLAFPYVILAISYEKGIFRGLRHYYSPAPIYSLDQPLYLPNLPNTNCKGYSETSLGWVCIYHRTHEDFTTVIQKLDYALARYDPMGEPYNFGNMPETDGYNFYKERGRPEWNWMPSRWSKRTEDKGLEWVLDPEAWIPILSNKSGLSYIDGGEPYTLRQALYNPHFAYYHEHSAVKLNEFAALTTDAERNTFNKNLIRTALVSGLGKVEPKKTLQDLLYSIRLNKSNKIATLHLGVDKRCAKCRDRFYLDYDAPYNVLTSLSGTFTSAGLFETNFSWYCQDCVNQCKAIPTPATKRFFTTLIDGDSIAGTVDDVTGDEWRPIMLYDPYNIKGNPTYAIHEVISEAKLNSFTKDLVGGVDANVFQSRCSFCGTAWFANDACMRVWNVKVAEDYKSYNLLDAGCRVCIRESYINPFLGLFAKWHNGVIVEIKSSDPVSGSWSLKRDLEIYFAESEVLKPKLTTVISNEFVKYMLYKLLGEKVDLTGIYSSISAASFDFIFKDIALTDPDSIPLDVLEERLTQYNLIKKVENIDS